MDGSLFAGIFMDIGNLCSTQVVVGFSSQVCRYVPWV